MAECGRADGSRVTEEQDGHTLTFPSDEFAGTVTSRLGSHRFGVFLGAELALAAVVGFVLLGRPSLWWDEAYSVSFVELGWADLFGIIRDSEAMHGFYYVVLKLWIPLAGTSEFALRAPSVVFFVVAVLALVSLGRLLFTDRIALIAGLLLIANPFMLVYAREARSYAMVTMLITVTTLLFVRLMLASRVELWLLALYTVLGILSVYAHAWSIFVLVVHAGTVIAVKGFRSKLLWMAGSWVSMAIVVSPLLYFFIALRGDQVSWIRPVGIGGFVLHFRRLAGGWVLMILYLIGALVALGVYWFKARRRVRRTWDIGMVTAWILVPPVLTFLLSLSVPVFLSRYLIVTLPALVLLVGVGVNAIKPRSIGYGMLGVVVLLSVVRNVPAYTSSTEDWRSATAFVLDRADTDDMIVFYVADGRVPYGYYEKRATATTSPEILRYEVVTKDQPESVVDALVASVSESGDRRVWVVLSHDNARRGPAIEQQLYVIHELESRTKFEGPILVIQLAPAGSAP